MWGTAIVLVIALGVALIAVNRGSQSTSSSSSSKRLPLLAPAGAPAGGQAVDGIRCETSEQFVLHVHAHLAVFVNGQERGVPADNGITSSCLYWLHSHDVDGIIHIESPERRTFTLGDYFKIWGQPLSAAQVGPAAGTVTAYLDGKKFTGDPSSIPLGDHARVQLDVGKDVAPRSYSFPSGL